VYNQMFRKKTLLIVVVLVVMCPFVIAGAAYADPAATADSYNIAEDDILNVPAPGVLGNDTGTGLIAELDTNVSHGTLNFNSDGSFDYTPPENYYGPDSFTYHADEAGIDSNIVTVSISVTAVNDIPTITGSPATTVEEDALYNFIPTANDVDGDLLTFSIVNKPTWATFSTETGELSGTPTNDHVGTTTDIVITVSDGALFASLSAFDLTVTNVNDYPVATDDSYSVDEDTILSVTAPGVLENDTDIDPSGDTLTAILTNDVSNGLLSLNPNGSFIYRPTDDFSGEDSFTYEVSDGQGGTAQGTVTITVDSVNDAPVLDDIPGDTMALLRVRLPSQLTL
jgi:VCBS repeat-containing protein